MDNWPTSLVQDGITRTFPVNGQGTLIYTKKGEDDFAIIVTPNKSDSKSKQGVLPETFIALVVEIERAAFYMKVPKYDEPKLLREKTDTKDYKYGTEENLLTSYWFSYDRDACVLKYGKGYRMVETTLLQYDLKKDYEFASEEERTTTLKSFFNATDKRYVMVMLNKDAEEKVCRQVCNFFFCLCW